jgi:hypothetical protein
MARTNHHHGVKTFAHGTRNLVRIGELSLPVIVGGLELRELIHEEGIARLPETLRHAFASRRAGAQDK